MSAGNLSANLPLACTQDLSGPPVNWHRRRSVWRAVDGSPAMCLCAYLDLKTFFINKFLFCFVISKSFQIIRSSGINYRNPLSRSRQPRKAPKIFFSSKEPHSQKALLRRVNISISVRLIFFCDFLTCHLDPSSVCVTNKLDARTSRR